MTDTDENNAAATDYHRFVIDEEHAGARLDKWLADRLEGLSRARVKALIEEGSLSRNNEPFTDPSWKMRVGESFALTIPEVAPAIPKGEDIPLDIFYEDEALIVVNKPAGLVVHPAAGHWSGTLVNALIHHCGTSLSGIGGVARPGIVHRIDKDTSGLLVVAKHDAAHQKLTAAFAVHDVERVYDAIVIGAPRPGIGSIEKDIARAGGDRKKFQALPEVHSRDDARHAITHYKLQQSYGRRRAKLTGDAVASLIACQLETGRTHQIRVHMSAIGHPLIGDPLYGRGPGLPGVKPGDEAADHAIAVMRNFRRQALHARVLGFEHPISGEMLRFEAEAPPDLRKLTTALEAL